MLNQTVKVVTWLILISHLSVKQSRNRCEDQVGDSKVPYLFVTVTTFFFSLKVNQNHDNARIVNKTIKIDILCALCILVTHYAASNQHT